MDQYYLADEILSVIFKNFLDDDNPSGSTLAVLARICRRFSEPALDLLWREVDTLTALVQCMPFGLWTLSQKKDDHGEVCTIMKFTRSLVETDWVRFEHYSSKIRVFGESKFKGPEIEVHHNIWLALSMYRPVKNLLPNLSSFHIKSSRTIHATPIFQAFLGSSLHTIYISDCDTATLNLINTSILRLCPNLKRVLGSKRTSLYETFTEIIHSLTTLTHINLPATPLSAKTIEHLSHYPNLKQLAFRDAVRDAINSEVINAPGQFLSLERLECHGHNWSAIITFLCQIQSHLTELSISSRYKPYSILELTRAIGLHPSISTLTTLVLVNERCTSNNASASVFDDLFQCKVLRRLRLCFDAVTTLDDAWVLKASLAWPHLQSICLNPPEREQSKITLAGFIPLVQHCPELTELSLQLHISPINPRLLDGIYNTNLTVLGLQTSTITSPGRVVYLLIRLFPSLRGIEVSPANARRSDWAEVKSLLGMMAYE